MRLATATTVYIANDPNLCLNLPIALGIVDGGEAKRRLDTPVRMLDLQILWGVVSANID